MADGRTDLALIGDKCSKNNHCETATDLSQYLKLSVKNILNSVTDEKFVVIYKTCYKEFEKKHDIERPALSGSSTEGKKYRSQFNEIIMKFASKSIEETISEMDSKLKELEELKLAQSGGTTVWRPPGDALEHIIPFECVSEMGKKKELEIKIEREQEELEILKMRVNEKRNKARKLHEDVLTSIQDIKQMVTSKVNDELI